VKMRPWFPGNFIFATKKITTLKELSVDVFSGLWFHCPMRTLLQIFERIFLSSSSADKAVRPMNRSERRHCEVVTMSMHAQARAILDGRTRKFG
jgi:hypothetical protein